MTGKFDTYLTYITRDFQEEKSLEQPGKPFQITVEEKGMLPLRQIIIKFSRHLIL
jgi:hypothetical protein